MAERFDQCDETCTVDCGHCKGRPIESLRDALRAAKENIKILEGIRDRKNVEHSMVVRALRILVKLKDGPRDDAYRAAKDHAWDNARMVIARHERRLDDGG